MAWGLGTEVLASELNKGMELQYRYLAKSLLVWEKTEIPSRGTLSWHSGEKLLDRCVADIPWLSSRHTNLQYCNTKWVGCRRKSSGSGYCPVAGSCEYSNDVRNSIKGHARCQACQATIV